MDFTVCLDGKVPQQFNLLILFYAFGGMLIPFVTAFNSIFLAHLPMNEPPNIIIIIIIIIFFIIIIIIIITFFTSVELLVYSWLMISKSPVTNDFPKRGICIAAIS